MNDSSRVAGGPDQKPAQCINGTNNKEIDNSIEAIFARSFGNDGPSLNIERELAVA